MSEGRRADTGRYVGGGRAGGRTRGKMWPNAASSAGWLDETVGAEGCGASNPVFARSCEAAGLWQEIEAQNSGVWGGSSWCCAANGEGRLVTDMVAEAGA